MHPIIISSNLIFKARNIEIDYNIPIDNNFANKLYSNLDLVNFYIFIAKRRYWKALKGVLLYCLCEIHKKTYFFIEQIMF